MSASSRLFIGGFFHVECYDRSGKLKWESLAKNGVTTPGLNHILDVEFHGSAQSTTWYISLIDSSGYTGLDPTDTMGSHAGWAECTAYDEATRPEWTEGAAAGGVITNATRVNFTMNATKTVKGAFLVDNSTRGGSTGNLFCTALFTGGDQAVEDDDVLKVKYTLTATAA